VRSAVCVPGWQIQFEQVPFPYYSVIRQSQDHALPPERPAGDATWDLCGVESNIQKAAMIPSGFHRRQIVHWDGNPAWLKLPYTNCCSIEPAHSSPFCSRGQGSLICEPSSAKKGTLRLYEVWGRGASSVEASSRVHPDSSPELPFTRRVGCSDGGNMPRTHCRPNLFPNRMNRMRFDSLPGQMLLLDYSRLQSAPPPRRNPSSRFLRG
jgi:hypothetical protein